MKIVSTTVLADSQGVRIVRVVVRAPDIALKAKAGQFVVVMASEEGERVPLTIVQSDPTQGTVALIVQEAGFTTRLLGGIKVGNSLYSIVGPLGRPTEIKKYGRVMLVAGGVGIAEIYPVAKAMKNAGNHVSVIIGSRSRELLILERELKEVSDELIAMTDDGSYGRRGFVTEALQELLPGSHYDLVYAVGPIPMMRAVSAVTQARAVPTLVSLNALMVDGTGMCGCCRVTVGKKVKFSCVDGPEFDAAQVDWHELLQRSSIYDEQEKHICRLRSGRIDT
jgi:ferredoxin/flavodoxin---NADP+ reductase